MRAEEREDLLEKMASRINRDNKKKFTVKKRLKLIQQSLTDTEYEILKKTPLSVIYKKKNVALSEDLLLISTHIDCKQKQSKNDKEGITKCFFDITKKGNYKGTFDNAATNAAIVIAMIDNLLSDNTIVAFTGDEEEDSNGAKQVIEYIENNFERFIAIALDLTFDLKAEENDKIHTYKHASYTIDNIFVSSNERIIRRLFEIAKMMDIKFMVTRADGSDDFFDHKEDEITEYYDKGVEVEDPAYPDEAIEYGKSKKCLAAFSLCLPSNDQEDDCNMHKDKGVKIKKSAFNEYIKAVVEISNGLASFKNL